MLQARRGQVYEATKEQLVSEAELLKERPRVQATISSSTISPAPDRFTVVPVIAARSYHKIQVLNSYFSFDR
jgi:hypothetical protein